MERREKQVLVRFTTEEKDIIDRAAKKAGETVAGLLRRMGIEESRKILAGD